MIKRNYFNVCFLSHLAVARFAAFAFVCLLGVSVARADSVFTSALGGNQAVPANNSTATGVGSVILNDSESQVTVTLNLNNLQNTSYVARIHGPAPRGSNGEVIFTLPAGVSTQSFSITPAVAANLKAGLWYFNVTTQNFPNGEIRGQIEPLCAPPPENMRNWFRAENSKDWLNSNITAQGGSTWSGGFGRVGNAFSFNGGHQYINFGKFFDYKTFTVSMWIKPGATQLAYANVVDNNAGAGQSWRIEQDAANTNQYNYADNGILARFSLEPNAWQHLTVVREEYQLRIYVNGVRKVFGAVLVPVNYNGEENLMFARNNTESNRFWKGAIDEFSVFDRPLAEWEIVNLYNSGSAGVCTESGVTKRAQNGKIAFDRWVNQTNQIFTMDSDGGNLINLTNDAGYHYSNPAFSADGKKIAFARNSQIFTMNSDGSNQKDLNANTTTVELSPRWSPNGNMLTFAAGGGDATEIYRINSDGTNLKRLTENSAYDYAAVWSPDMSTLVFTSNRDGNGSSIYTMNTDGTGQLGITSGFSDRDPSWSPDSSKLVFDRNGDICLINKNGTGFVNLTNTPYEFEGNPSFSPDGTKILFYRFQNDSRQIWQMNSDGSNEVSLLDSGMNYLPTWQPIPNPENITPLPGTNIRVSFYNVIAPGRTVATPLLSNQIPHLPSGFAPYSPIYDVRTSASYVGDIIVSFDVPSVPHASACSSLRVMHFTYGGWNEGYYSSQVFNNGICTVSQVVYTLSPFMIGRINSNPQTLSGTITYGITPVGQAVKLVPNVTLTANGGSIAAATTSSNGSYLLGNLLGNEQYTVTPSKTGNISGITPFDATLVLRCVAAGTNCTLTANQKLAADTNNSNTITPFDATQILRYVAANAQTNATGAVGNWKFSPAPRNYSLISNTLDNENYDAILIGEVNGNWMPPISASLVGSETTATGAADNAKESVAPEEQLKQPETDMEVSLPTNATAPVGSTILIPVAFTNSGQPINAFSFGLTFNPNVLAPDAVNPVEQSGTLCSNFLISVHNTDSGRIGVAGAVGNNAILTSGTLINLRFKVIGTAGDADTGATQLKFEQGREQTPAPDFRDQNDVSILPSISNGAFTVQNVRTSDSVKVKGKILTADGSGIRRR